MKALALSLLPYLRRGLRVFIYAAIPVAAVWLSGHDDALFVAQIQMALGAALLALLDKGQIAIRAARKP